MFDTLKMKLHQKKQYIKDIQNAPIRTQFRGLPNIKDHNCNNCGKCLAICPTGALSLNPLSIDMGKCTFCGACKNICTQDAINFSSFYKLGVDNSDKLIVTSEISEQKFYDDAISVRQEIFSKFHHSLKLRQVSAGGCGGCEMELNAAGNANFDMGRFGIDFVASPRHADGLVITGPITKNMSYALENCYKSVPHPKIVILCGACAISGGVFQDSNEIEREFIKQHHVDLFIPGCPVHPLTFINAVLDFIRK